MIKQTIKYLDIMTNEQVEGDFYFHLNKAEVLRIMARSGEQDWEKYVRSILDSGDSDRILNLFESIIHDAVGQRTPDGLFVKSADFRDAFIASEAYGELFLKFITEPDFAQSFWSSIVAEGKPANAKTNQQMKALATGGKQKRNQRHNNKHK